MLLALVALSFAIAEGPQGILLIFSAINEDFFVNYYVQLGDILDILTLTNGVWNFILYCVMSSQFRSTFLKLFCKFLGNWCDSRSQPNMANDLHPPRHQRFASQVSNNSNTWLQKSIHNIRLQQFDYERE